MASGYERVTKVSGTASVSMCVELPAPPRGTLDRLIVTQTSGSAGAGTINIYNRKGACSTANDIKVASSGGISTVADDSGSALVTTDADHLLKVGDAFEVKGCSVSAYNVTHTVTAVVSDVVVITDISYTSAGTGGLWQTSPFIPTNAPASHLIFSGTLSSGSLQAFDIDRGYENRDNQYETMRTRNTALWAEFVPATTADYEIAMTCEADNII